MLSKSEHWMLWILGVITAYISAQGALGFQQKGYVFPTILFAGVFLVLLYFLVTFHPFKKNNGR